MEFLTNKKTFKDTPEGSGALTEKQLELLRFRKKQVGITDEEYSIVVTSVTGQKEDNKIPFAKVGDVLGGLDKLGEFKKKGVSDGIQ